MLIGKKLSITAVILYMLVSHVCEYFLKVHWIHIFNSFMLVCILHNLLEWKYDWIDQTEEGENDESERD